MNAALLMLTDGRFPSGGHAHSSGLEAAVAAGWVKSLSDVEEFLRGRLATAGPVAAAFAAAATAKAVRLADEGESWQLLDAELDARMTAAAARAASRKQGKALLRAGRRTWPSPLYDVLGPEPHQAIALGVVAAAAGLSARESALAAAYGVLTGPASAAVRLLGLDPYATQHLVSKLNGELSCMADEAAAAAKEPFDQLPDWAAPLSDIAAEIHATWEVRLFAS